MPDNGTEISEVRLSISELKSEVNSLKALVLNMQDNINVDLTPVLDAISSLAESDNCQNDKNEENTTGKTSNDESKAIMDKLLSIEASIQKPTEKETPTPTGVDGVVKTLQSSQLEVIQRLESMQQDIDDIRNELV